MSDPRFEMIGRLEDKAMEECGELVKAICKAKRFGWHNFHPKNPSRKNLDHVIAECEDVAKAVRRLKRELKKGYDPEAAQ